MRAAREESNDFRWRDKRRGARGLSFARRHPIVPAPMPTSPTRRRLYALVPCAGSGVRAGATLPKQYVEIAGRPLVAHTLAALLAVPRLSRILVVVAPDDEHYEGLAALPSDPRLSVARCGGQTRAATVAAGLAKLAGLGAAPTDWVLVHDAARCLVRAEWIDALVESCRGDGIGGLLALPVADTLKRAEGDRAIATMARDDVWQAQTPQMFRLGVLTDALKRTPGATDEAAAIEAVGLRPKLVVGSAENIKVTHPADFAIADALLARRLAA
jgi:2-C-methyl-D-erythritol 4-phosphate cytidylyltransferase